MLPGTDGVLVQRAPRPARESGSVQEDAGVVDEAGAPFDASLLVLAALRVNALGASGLRVLPLIIGKFLCRAHDAIAVLAAREVRSIGAAALHHFRRGLGEHTLAAVPEDALPVRSQERDVDLPAPALFLRVVEGHPLTGRPGPGSRRAQNASFRRRKLRLCSDGRQSRRRCRREYTPLIGRLYISTRSEEHTSELQSR